MIKHPSDGSAASASNTGRKYKASILQQGERLMMQITPSVRDVSYASYDGICRACMIAI